MCLFNFSPMCLFKLCLIVFFKLFSIVSFKLFSIVSFQNFSHLGLVDPLQRQLLLLTSSPPGGDKLWGREGAFSFLVLRMLCVWGLGWYWVLGVGPTGYTDSRAPGTRTERESWDAAPGFLFRDTGGKQQLEKVLRNFVDLWKKLKRSWWQFLISHHLSSNVM